MSEKGLGDGAAGAAQHIAATPCVVCEKDGDYDEMVCGHDGQPAHPLCQAIYDLTEIRDHIVAVGGHLRNGSAAREHMGYVRDRLLRVMKLVRKGDTRHV